MATFSGVFQTALHNACYTSGLTVCYTKRIILRICPKLINQQENPPTDVPAFTAQLDRYYRQALQDAPQSRWLKHRTMTPSSSHLVLIPSFNPGMRVLSTVRDALSQWAPVWVVVDGSTDHSAQQLSEMAAAEPNLRVWVLPRNGGKGAAVLFGAREAQALGFTHVLTLDSDGQHPTASIRQFMQASLASPKLHGAGRTGI